MADARGQSNLPTAFEMLESVLLTISAVAVGAPTLPGFRFCVPALGAVAVVVIAPLVVGAALVTLAGVILAIPYLLVVRSIRSRRPAPAPAPAPASVPG